MELLRSWRPYAAAVSGFLLLLAGVPFNLWFLAWTSAVLFLLAIWEQPFRRSSILGFFFLVPWLTPWAYWSWPMAPWLRLVLGVLLSLAFGGVLGLIPVVQKRWPGVPYWVTAPTVWCTLEFLRLHIPYLNLVIIPPLAHTLWSRPFFLQLVSVFGELSLSFLIFMVNALIVLLLKRSFTGLSRGEYLGYTVAFLLLALMTVTWYLPKAEAQDPVTVAVVQGATQIDPAIRNSENPLEKRIEFYSSEVNRMARQGADIVVLPEVSVGVLSDTDYCKHWSEKARENGVYLLVLLPDDNYSRTRPLITTVFFGPKGQEVGRYSKRFLVPFTEARHASPGREDGIYETPLGRIGELICYDVNNPVLGLRTGRKGAELFLVPFNDTGFPRNFFQLHKNFALFRAVESGVPLALAGETGMSLLAERSGAIKEILNPYTRGTAIGELTPGGGSLFTRGGFIFGPLVALFGLFLMRLDFLWALLPFGVKLIRDKGSPKASGSHLL